MKLNKQQLETITFGAVRICEDDSGFHFHRFTEEEEALFQGTETALLLLSPSGIKLCFKTNTKTLRLNGFTERVSPVRSFYAIDIVIDGELYTSIKNYDDSIADTAYCDGEFPFGAFDMNLALADGWKTIEIHLPYSAKLVLQSMELDEGALIEPLTFSKKLFAYGDSITHGFDALHPSNRAAAKICKKFKLEEYNKGIGGAAFDPKLAEICSPITPDYIIAAYGTNDYCWRTQQAFQDSCQRFLEQLAANYPSAKIFAVSPLRRLDTSENEVFGKFSMLGTIIEQEISKIKNGIYINGYDCIPEDAALFADRYLHPTDQGFDFYYKALAAELEKYL